MMSIVGLSASNPNTKRGILRIQIFWQLTLLELAGRVFRTDLIILKGEGLDVILGMSWMKLHGVVLDIAGRLVHLDSPVYGKVILHLPAVSHIKASLHHVVELNLRDIHVP
jgi:hypothetical protein